MAKSHITRKTNAQIPKILQAKETERKEDLPIEYRRALQELIRDFKDGEKSDLGKDLIKGLDAIHRKFKPSGPDASPRAYDIESDEFSREISSWTKKLIVNINQARTTDLAEIEEAQVHEHCQTYFRAVAGYHNCKSIAQEIECYYAQEEKPKPKEFAEELSQRYPISKRQAKKLIKAAHVDLTSPLATRRIYKAIANKYGLTDKKWQSRKVTGTLILSSLMQSAASFCVLPGTAWLGNASQLGSVALRNKSQNELLDIVFEIRKEMDQRIADTLVYCEARFMDENDYAHIQTTLENGRDASSRLIMDTVSGVNRIATTMVGTVAILAYMEPLLALGNLASLPLSAYIASKAHGKVQKLTDETREASIRQNREIHDITASPEETLTAPNREKLRAQLEAALVDANVTKTNQSRLNVSLGNLHDATINTGALISNATAGAMFYTGMIGPTEFTSNLMVGGHVRHPFIELMVKLYVQFPEFAADIRAMEQVFESTQIEKPDSPEEQARKGVSELDNFDLQVEGLKFITPGNHKKILSRVGFELKAGEFVTLSGESGGGKSTLRRLIMRLYNNDGGEVRLGGVDVNDIKKTGEDSYYSKVACIRQDPPFFEHMTLRENLLRTNQDQDISNDRIIEVLKKVGLESHIEKLDKQVSKPSGGQKMRMALAGILLRDAKVLILDEPTSGLDPETRAGIIETLQALKGDHSILCITHNEKMQAAGDRYLHLEDGKIIEKPC